jgi:hypothetical protein
MDDVFVFDYWAFDERWMAAPPRQGRLRHVVCYSFLPDTSEEERLTRVGGFAELIEAVGIAMDREVIFTEPGIFYIENH